MNRSRTEIESPENYLELDSDKIISTISRLRDRIADRFPDSDLTTVCAQLLSVAKLAKQRAQWIAEPVRWVRYSALCISVGLVALVIVAPALFAERDERLKIFEFIQTMEAGINDVVLIVPCPVFSTSPKLLLLLSKHRNSFYNGHHMGLKPGHGWLPSDGMQNAGPLSDVIDANFVDSMQAH